MNPAHSFFYLIGEEAFNDSVLSNINDTYYDGILNYYPGINLKSIDSHPEKWELYAISSGNKSDYLNQINPQNGALTEIGDTSFKEITDISFRDDGTLWGWAKGHGLIKINPQTAASELIFPSEIEIEALTWNNYDELYLGQGTYLWKYDGNNLKRSCDIFEYIGGKSIKNLEMLKTSTLVVSVYGQSNLLQINVLLLDFCIISKSMDIVSEYISIENITYTNNQPLHFATPNIGTSHLIDDILKPKISNEIDISFKISGGTGNVIDIPSLLFEEITPEGFITLGKLYDDGTHGDRQANDYRYSAKFIVRKDIEGEYCYQVRTETPFAGVELVSDSDCLWVLSLPTERVDSEIVVKEGLMVSFTEDTSILRIKEIILAEGATVLADIPSIRELLVRIESEPRSKVIERFRKYPEVQSAIPNRYPSGEGFPRYPDEHLGFYRTELTFMKDSFESNLKGWETKETCFITDKLDQFTATDGEKFLVCSTYPNGKTAWIKKAIDIPYTDSIIISFDYNIITQEDKATLNDKIRLSLVDPNGHMTPIVVNVAEVSMSDSTLQLAESEITIKQTGWQSTSVEIPITESKQNYSSSGKGFLSIIIHSENDPSIGGESESNNLHSALLVDNIRISRSE